MKSCNLELSDGILIATYNKNLIVDFELAEKLVNERLAFQNGKNYPVIIHLNGIKTTDKNARHYMANEGIKGITMGGFIVNSAVEEVVFNFFLRFAKPAIPTRAFRKEEDAAKWIKEYKLNKD